MTGDRRQNDEEGALEARLARLGADAPAAGAALRRRLLSDFDNAPRRPPGRAGRFFDGLRLTGEKALALEPRFASAGAAAFVLAGALASAITQVAREPAPEYEAYAYYLDALGAEVEGDPWIVD